MSLDLYQQKRDFNKTSEPAGDAEPDRRGPLRFVVQKHDARRLHYDFRLEVDGVLKSWPIPKGPSMDPNEKRLAVMTEDHPLDYATFEGVIPKGEYGAGPVIVWDAGIYGPVVDDETHFDRDSAEEHARRGIEKGKLSIRLHGRKLRGVWTLIRSKNRDWLFFKNKDEDADPERDLLKDEDSVLSGLNLDDLRAGQLPDELDKPALIPSPAHLPGAKKAPFPTKLAPMLPSLTERPFSHPDWLFEPKLDGYRFISTIRDGQARLISRTGRDATHEFESIVHDLPRQPFSEMVLDGEIVALDESGRPSFQAIQNRGAGGDVRLLYYVFDLLYVDGYDLRGAALEDRKKVLDAYVVPGRYVQVVQAVPEAGEAFYKAATELGLEGMVAKRRTSVYETGRRSQAWLKVKSTHTDDFVVAGYTAGTGNRSSTLGSLVLGQYDPESKELKYAGHVGTGFDERLLKSLKARLEKLKTDKSPFPGPLPSGGRWNRRDAPITWVRPELVAEIKFAERTRDGILRAPVFVRLREDKKPTEAAPAATVQPPDETDRPDEERTQARNPGPSVQELESSSTDAIKQLSKKGASLVIEVDGYQIPFSNLDKVFWPAQGRFKALTKRDLAKYYAFIAPWLLPHLRDRPITLVRFPNGITGEHFYQKHWEHKLPPFVETVDLYSDHNSADGEYVLCNNLATLLWFAQIGNIELHSWYSRVAPDPDGPASSTTFSGSLENIRGSALNYPDFIVFDLDPYVYSGKEAEGDEPELHREGFAKTTQVALWVKELLDAVGLRAFVKTTGRTGLHIYCPIKRVLTYEQTHAMSEVIARHIAQSHPDEVTIEWAVKKRTGKIFVDYNQNVRGKTLASVYSPRRHPHAPVSVPVEWAELEAGTVYPTNFNLRSVEKRIREVGDLWANILDHATDVSHLLDMTKQD